MLILCNYYIPKAPKALELLSSLFQSITLANRITINLLAGSLLLALVGIALNYCIILHYSIVVITIMILLMMLFIFEEFNSLIQLFIFSLLTVEYLALL